MKIAEIDVNSLKPYPKNAKRHDERQIQNVAESIRQFGFVQPIVIDGENVVVIGHCRLEAAKRLGLETVPCLKVEELTQEQINTLRLVDNKTNESAWDFDILSDELKSAAIDGFDLNFQTPELEFDWDNVEEISEDNYDQPEKEKLRCPICGGVDLKVHFVKVEKK